jgi:APA family basic amino acid/polyamine antiporter
MTKSLASPGLILAVWTFMGVATLCGALCYGELASRFPRAGGGYVYLREAFGPRVAFLYGWQCLLVMDPGLTAALATGVGAYAAALIPGLPVKAVAIGAILSAAAINLSGLRPAGGLGQILSYTKVALLALVVACAFGSRRGEWGHFTPFWAQHPGAPPLVPALAGALVAAFFSFGGWWDLSKAAADVRAPSRTLPRAMGLGVAVVTVLYVAVSAAFLFLVPSSAIGSSETFAAQAAGRLFGARGAMVMSVIVVVTVSSSLLAFMTVAPRVYYAMASDGLGFGRFARVHQRTQAPTAAILAQTLLGCALVAVGAFEQIVGYFIFVTVAFLGVTVVGLFRLRRSGERTGFQTPMFPFTPVVFLAMVALILVLLAAGRPKEALAGVVVTSLGAPLYGVSRRKKAERSHYGQQ